MDWDTNGDAVLILDAYADMCDYADEYTQTVLLDGRDIEHPIPAKPALTLDDNLEPVIEPETLSEEEIISLKIYASKFDQGDGGGGGMIRSTDEQIKAEFDKARKFNKATNRICGTCAACCTALPVTELEKQAYEPCCHLGKAGKGCAIYSNRPYGCRAWSCAWLLGMVGENVKDRPDQSGIVVDVALIGGQPYWRVFEMWKDAAGSPKNELTFRKMLFKFPAALIDQERGVWAMMSKPGEEELAQSILQQLEEEHLASLKRVK